MDCRTTSALEFRARLGFKQYDVILTKKQSVITEIMSSFEGENMLTQCNVLSYRIHLYFHGYKLAIEIDENGHSDRNIIIIIIIIIIISIYFCNKKFIKKLQIVTDK